MVAKPDRTNKSNRTSKSSQAPWYEQMRHELAKRRDRCQLMGLDNVYQLPFDPFVKYKDDFDGFMEKVPYKPRMQCKPPWLGSERDASRRVFVDAQNEKMCRGVKGIWKPSATNRKNGYDTGVCWTNPEDAHCGTRHEVPGALRKELSGLVGSTYKTHRQACMHDPKCTWMSGAHDCYSKRTAAEQTEVSADKVFDPPPTMPKQITRGSDLTGAVEPFLYDWYTHKKPSVPPATSPLFGTGNRCSDASAQSDVQLPTDLRSFDPTQAPDAQMALLDKMIGHTEFKEFVRLKKEADATRQHLPDDYIDFLNTRMNESMQKKFALSLPQSVVNMVMKTIARSDKESTSRGLLAWHSTGSGKTCTATAVMEAFWDTKRQIIFASSLDAIASNPDYKFHECAMRFFPRFKTEAYVGGKGTRASPESIMAKIGEAFQKRDIRFLSFAKLANRIQKTEAHKKALQQHLRQQGGKQRQKQARKQKDSNIHNHNRGSKNNQKTKSMDIPRDRAQKARVEKKHGAYVAKRSEKATAEKKRRASAAATAVSKIAHDDYIDLDNAVLIIDEVHNLFRPLATQRQQHEYLEAQLVDPTKHPNLKVVILTATPGDNVPDVMKLLNIIRDVYKHPNPIKPPNPKDASDILRFKNDIRGMISFFDMSSDNTKFPVVYDHDPIKYPMSMRQFTKYLEAYKEDSTKKLGTDYERLAKLNQLNKFWKASRKYSNMLYNFEKDMMLHEFSSKLPALLERIKGISNEKHYVYSAFFENRNNGYGSHGILTIAKFLESELGYTKLTVAEAKKLNAAGQMPAPGKKRYILAVQKEIGEEGSSTAGKNLHEMIKLYNSPQNKNGEYIHVMLASQGFNEGIDLKAVRHIHIFEPLVTMASDKQTLGRAARYCSHADLDRDKGEWTVTIHRYMSDLPIDLARPNLPVMQHNIGVVQRELMDFERQLGELPKAGKGVGQGAKEEKARLKEAIKIRKAVLKKEEKAVRDAEKQDVKNIESIDAFIYKESKERMLELFTVYHSMKESAMDCRLLSSFHSRSTEGTASTSAQHPPIQCQF